MQARVFGSTGVRVPVIGQGTWYMERDRGAVVALQQGIAAGLTHIDTAEMYGSGAVEKLVGRAIAGRRDEVFLVSKVLPSNASREGTRRACERSLARLATDRLDLYLLHWPGSHPFEETLEGFEQLLAEGKIRAYGVSNFDVDDLEAIASVAGAGRIACNQVLYHPGDRTLENRVLPWCREHAIPIVAYSPFGHGSLPAPNSAPGEALQAIAARRGVSRHQVALRFVVRHEDVFAIPKAANPRHVADNAAAGDWELAPDEIERLEASLPRAPTRAGLSML
jgi:diketogulonate reductase-like aldo/keto reductase